MSYTGGATASAVALETSTLVASSNRSPLPIVTDENAASQFATFSKILIGFACLIVILLAVVGNLLVVTVILRFKRLKNATNYILLSLALADISVAFLVMIPATIQEMQQKWVFSQLFCKFYTSFDITCCTASILNLLLVAIDRYIAIFKPLTYRNILRTWHVFTAVVLVWILSLCISFIPIFLGWNLESKPPAFSSNSNSLTELNDTVTAAQTADTTAAKHNQPPSPLSEICYIEANVTYAIISSSLSFWIPFVLMTIVYIQIYIVAKRQAKAISQIYIHRRNSCQQVETSMPNLNAVPSHSDSVNNILTIDADISRDKMKHINQILTENGEYRSSDCSNSTDRKSRFLKIISQLKTIEKKRTKDTKAVKTLGIIMGKSINFFQEFHISLNKH